jgi:hypothetical protein
MLTAARVTANGVTTEESWPGSRSGYTAWKM